MAKLNRGAFVDLIIQVTGLQTKDLHDLYMKVGEELDRRNAERQAKVEGRPTVEVKP